MFVFGAFELDAEAGELRRAGQQIALQPRVFETLHYLVSNAGRVVSRDELLGALWGGQQLNDVAVPWSISHARKALDQGRRERRPIETVRGQGYRFVADVRQVSPVDQARHVGPGHAPGVPRLFLGRDGVMKRLSAALDSARVGEGSMCLLTGEGGIGKTRCASELAARARMQGLDVATGRCVGAPVAPALWPWVQILRQCVESLELNDASDEQRREAQALLQQLAPQSGAEVVTPELPDEASFWLLDRLCRFMRQTTHERVRVLIIDDLQYADESSLHALGLLVPELASMRMLIVGTARDLPDSQQGYRASDLIARLRPCERLPLDGLPAADVARYLATALAEPPAAELTAAVLARTAGNPLFVSEVVALLLAERDRKGNADPSDIKLPEVARGLLLERVRSFDEATQRVLESASVIGREFELSMLSQVTGLDGHRLLSSLDQALEGHFIESRRGPELFAFGHELLRDALYDSLTVARRVELHAKIAQALESTIPNTSRLSELAFHCYHALPQADHDRVVRHCVAAGRAAARVFAYAQAVQYYGWALSAQRAKPGADPRSACELLVHYAAALMSSGRPMEARQQCRAAIALAREHRLGDWLVAATRFLRPSILFAQHEDRLLVSALEEALSLLPEEATAARAQAYSRLACVPPYSLFIDRSQELSRKAVTLASESDDKALMLEALRSRFHSLSGPDHIDELLSVADQVLRLDRHSASWWAAESRLARYQALSLRGDTGAADKELEAFGSVVEKLRLAGSHWEYRRLRAQGLFHAGELERAEQRFEELWSEGQRLGLRWAADHYIAQRTALQLERAAPGVVLSEQPMPATGAPAGTLERLKPLAAYRVRCISMNLHQGRLEAAREEFHELVQDSCRAVPRDASCLSTLIRLSRQAVALEEKAHAHALYDLLLPYADYNALNSFLFWLGSTSHYLGLLAAWFDRPQQAEDHFAAAVQMNERIGYPAQTLRSTVALARTLLASGSASKRKQGKALATTALADAQRLRLTRLASTAARLC